MQNGVLQGAHKNYSTKDFVMKICVYCSSKENLSPIHYEIGHKFGHEMAQRGHSLVYGGYNKGIMQAVAGGVAEQNGEIIAVIPKIFDKPTFTFRQCSKVIVTATMHERKATMEREADAFAILPGGIGTMDEFFELFVLNALGELSKPMAILDVDGCYRLLEQFLNQNAKDGFLSEDQRNLVKFYKEIPDILEALEKSSLAPRAEMTNRDIPGK